MRLPLAAATTIGLLLPCIGAAQPADPLSLPGDLSPWGMFEAADVVVKSVMIGLAIASVVTWTVAFYKLVEVWTSSRATRRVPGTATRARCSSSASDWPGSSSTARAPHSRAVRH